MTENESNNQMMEILQSIFLSIEGKILPIIKISEKISFIIKYLNEESNTLNNKLKLLSLLHIIFQENKLLIHYFVTKCKTDNINLLECIINLYYLEGLTNENKIIIENLLNLIVDNSSSTKSIFEFIYQKLSFYFIDDNINKINEEYLLKSFKLLQIFYKDLSSSNEESKSNSINDNNEINKYVIINKNKVNKKEETKDINNYIYFNGKGSSLSLTLNKNSINVNTHFPTLENGISVLFWIYLDKDLTNYFLNIYKNLKIYLVTLNISGHHINLLFNSIKSFKLVVDETISNDIDFTNKFVYNDWNNICFLVEKKSKLNIVKIVINGFETSFSLPLPKTFPINAPITKIKLFENFFGKISTVLFFSFNLNMQMISHFKSNYKYGFHKNKYLFKFLNSNDEEYFSNSPEYNYYQKYKTNTKSNNANKLFKIRLKEHNIKYSISCFVPFTYDRDKNTIDDIFGNFVGVLGYDDGVNNYMNYTSALNFIGGINNLLPFAEMMYINKDILKENTFYEYLHILDEILIGHTKNLVEANKNKFFSSLGLFFEKYPSNIYTNKILEIFLKIGKETFQLSDDKSSCDNFVNMILLNEKIFSKFSPENQSKLWEEVYQFFVSDYSQMRESLNISKICLLLRFYDEKKYEEYCCKRHHDLFQIKSDKNNNEKICELKIMNPEMNYKIDKLFDIIQLYIKEYYKEKEIVNLYKLLSLDLSPCLQKKIIQAFINYFSGKNINIKEKTTALENLLRNNFLEISEYVLSISLLDVRIEVLKLFKILFQNNSNTIKTYISNNNASTKDNKDISNNNNNSININNSINNMPTLNSIISAPTNNACTSILIIYRFIRENLLPEKLMVEVDNNLANNNTNNNKLVKVTYPLINYLNKNCYEEDKCCLWTVLDSWFAAKETPTVVSGKKPKYNIRLNGYVLDFCISFVSSDVPAFFIDTFIKALINYINDNNIINRDVIYDNKNLFPWLIETLFYFFDKSNVESIESKKLVESIQKCSILLYNEYFSNKKVKEDFTYKINYIFQYSNYMKKLYQNDQQKLNEISNATRILLEKLMEYSSGDELNIKSQIYFDFMFLHKNNEENLNMIYNDGYESDLNNYTGKKLKKTKRISFDSDEEFDTEEDKSKINLLNEFTKYIKNLKKNNELIPDYIYDGLYFNEDLINSSKSSKKNDKSNPLKEIWKDYYLYDNIIDSYRANIWGIENLCKKAKIEYGGNPLILSQKLIKAFGESKKCKNTLTADILKCLGIKNTINPTNTLNTTNTINPHGPSSKNVLNSMKEESDKLKINILKINLILLCVAIDIVKDTAEKEFIMGSFQQFIIYCVLASINVSSSEKYYTKIQLELYDILLFGLTFFQKRDKSKFDKTYESLIKPIFEEISNVHTKKGIKGLFTKKNLFKNTAIVKLFVPEDTYKSKEKEKEQEDFDEIDQEDELNSTMMVGYGYATDRRNVFRKEIPGNIMYKDDTTIDKKKKPTKYILRIEDPRMISGKIFDSFITLYKNKRNKEGKSNKIKLFYRSVHPYSMDQKYADEKQRINNIVKEIIPFFESFIKKYSNTSVLQEKKRRNEYKKCKKELFSWRGFWSNRYLFFEHPELLKLRKKNHFTKEMTQPLLAPILDIDYYLPEFKKFDKNKLFNKNNYNYRINLDIDDILKEEEIKEKEKKINIYKKNQFGFNYLECLYKLPYQDLWEQYKYYHESDFNFEKISQKENNINNNYGILSQSSTINSNKEANLNSVQEKEKEKDKDKEKEKIDKKNQPIENTYHCCMVKLTHHIKGFISTQERYIKFSYDNDINLEELDDPNFDKDMGSCFGSIFKNHKKDKDKIDFIIEYLNIKYMFIRHYFYNESAIEIYTESNKSYFLNFKNNKELSQFIYDVQHHSFFREIKTEDYKGRKLLGYESIPFTTKKKSYSIYHKSEDWQNYSISTLEYIMWMNIYAGRSFNDLTQYPVFPWILANYKTESLNIKNDLRNINLPMGMMELFEKSALRKETFIDTYDSLKNDLMEANPSFNYQEFLKKGDEYYDNYKYKKSKREKTMSMANPEENMTPDTNISSLEINQLPYYFGSHYSNPTYITNFLTRTFPFSLVAIEIQGEKFDDPDRMFISLQKTFESASSLKDDVRELIPEFYTLPEILLNVNNFNLAQDKVDSEGKQIIINNVELPPWSKNKTTNFVVEMRRTLENSELKINKWVDLIFGNLQRGVGAEENHNIFMAHTYERMVKIDSIEDADSRNALMRLVETGVTPFQLFDKESRQKIDKNEFFTKNSIYSSSKDNFLEECKSIKALRMKSAKFTEINNSLYQNNKHITNKEIKQDVQLKISKIVYLSPNNLRIFTNTNSWYNLKYNISNELKIEEESNSIEIENNSNKFASSYLINSISIPFIVYSNNKYMVKGGFWDGRIELNSLVNGPKEGPYNTCIFPNCGPITIMEMSKNEQFLICGTKLGVVIVFQVYDKNIQIKQKLFLHTDEITAISINDSLNMFATAAKDGYIMLNTLPTLELVRAIKVKFINKKKLINIYATNVFLSSCPIPVIVIYSSDAKIFKSYSINGLNINEQGEEDYSENIKCFCIYNNIEFQDFLIYGTDDGLVKIRKFPEMNIVNNINPFDGVPIETLTVSKDKRYCFVWGRDNQIGIIKDNTLNVDDKGDNFGRLGYIKK